MRVPPKYYAIEIGIPCNVEASGKCDKAIQCEPKELEMRSSLPKAQSSPVKPKTVLDESFILTNENQNCSMEWMPSDDIDSDGELECEIDHNVDSEINKRQTHLNVNFWFLNSVCCSFSPYAIFVLVHA